MIQRRNERTNVVKDMGNGFLKDVILGQPLGNEMTIAHAVQNPNSASYGAMVQKAKYQTVAMRNTAVFEMNERAYIIGDGATHSGHVNRVTGDGKYVKGYWDALLVATLLCRFPEGHDNLAVAIAHPANAFPYVEQMMDILGGKHIVKTPDGRIVKFFVRELIPWVESEGSMLRWMELPAQISEKGARVGKSNAHNVRVGDRILVIDIGDKISSMTAVMVADDGKFETIYDPTEQPFDLGIQDVLNTLEMELKSLYPETFRGLKQIPLNMLQEALRTNFVTVSGRLEDVTQAVKNSIFSLIDQLEQRYQNKHGGGKNYSVILSTGGGGGLLFKHLVDEKEGILHHPYVYLAEQEKFIQFANVRGGAIAFGAWLAEQLLKVKR